LHESDPRHCAHLRAVIALLAAAPSSRLLSTRHLCASLIPAAPTCVMANVALLTDVNRVADAVSKLRAADGFRHSVWVPATLTQPASTTALWEFGYEQVSVLPGMTVQLSELTTGPVPAHFTASRSSTALAHLARINAVARPDAKDLPSAWTLPDSRLPDTLGVHLAWEGDQPVSGFLTLYSGSDCIVAYVATLPPARRRGHTAALLRAALRDAARDGLRTSTIRAERHAVPTYEGVGYRRDHSFVLYRLPPAFDARRTRDRREAPR